MRGRHVLVVTSLAFVAFGIACVDLFHSTDFATLCTSSPGDPRCGSDAATLQDAVIDTAVDARRPHPNFCQWSSADARAQALRACAWLGACEGPLGEGTLGKSVFGSCVLHAQLAYDCAANPSLRPAGDADELWSCLTTVSTCGDVNRCVFPGGVEHCPAVPAGSSFTACGKANGAVRVECASPTEGRAAGVQPCVLLGKTCSTEDPSAASCSGVKGFTCTTTTCVGTAAVDCNLASSRTFDRGVDCTKAGGGTCLSSDAGPDPVCAAGIGAPRCAVDALPTCEGNVVTSCVGGHEIRVDCNEVGLRCDDTSPVPAYDPAAACIGRAATCIEDDSCVGARLNSCTRGAPYEVDCISVGLGGCKVTSGRAACVP